MSLIRKKKGVESRARARARAGDRLIQTETSFKVSLALALTLALISVQPPGFLIPTMFVQLTLGV